MRIGLAGLGTVGSGLARILGMNREWTQRRIGRDISIKTVLEKRLELKHRRSCPARSRLHGQHGRSGERPGNRGGGGAYRRRHRGPQTHNRLPGGGANTWSRPTRRSWPNTAWNSSIWPGKKGLHLCYEASVAGGHTHCADHQGPPWPATVWSPSWASSTARPTSSLPR